MRGFVRNAATALVAASVVVAAPAAALAAPTTQERGNAAANFLSSEQKPSGVIKHAFSPIGSTADAVLAWAADRHGRTEVRDAMKYLAAEVAAGHVNNIGLSSKVILAVVAAGKDPLNFGGQDLILGITSNEQPSGQYGAGTAVFDHALAILALRGAGVAVSANARQWLADAQCDDGGWQYDNPAGPSDDAHCVDTIDPGNDWFASDTNATSYAVQALQAAGGIGLPAIDPFTFFTAIRDAQFHGWGYTWGFETTDANSTALVIQAYQSTGTTLPAGAWDALKRLQYRTKCGAFAFTWVDDGNGGFMRSGPNTGATIAALPGLFRRPLPIAKTDLLILVTPRVVCPQ